MADDIAAREADALEQLERVGTVVLYEPMVFEEADPLLGKPGGWSTGTCVVRLESDTGKTKRVVGISATHCWSQTESWLAFQRSLKPEAANYFGVVVKGLDLPEYEVLHRPAGDTATTAARREEVRQRVIAFDGSTARLESESR